MLDINANIKDNRYYDRCLIRIFLNAIITCMKELENNAYFWQKLDALYLSGDFKVIYKKGSNHPKFHGSVFPCDYGHIETLTGEGQTSLKVFKGNNTNKVQAVVICANLLDKDVNVIAFVGLSEEVEQKVLSFLNQNDFQKTVIVRRGKEVPDWTIVE